MERQVRGWTLGSLAGILGGALHGPADLWIEAPASAGEGSQACLTFAGDAKHLAKAEASDVGAVLVGRDVATGKPSIQVESPKESFAQFLFLCAVDLPIEAGVHPTAIVHPTAQVDGSASVGAYAVVERDAIIGPECRVYAFAYIGEGCQLNHAVKVFPHAVLYQDVTVGARTIIHAGVVIGADGFGYAWDGSKHLKIPQVGGVRIGADVELGALAAVDRGMIGDTSVGDDTKLDNMVHIGHNTKVGEHSIMAAQTGIGGSSEIGSGVMMGGQVGVADHVRIVDKVILAAGSATTVDIEVPGAYKGFPVRPVVTTQRIDALMGRLPDMAKRMKELERRIAELESKR